MSFLTKILLNEIPAFSSVYSTVIEPIEKFDQPFRNEYTFNIYQRALDVLILPKYSEYEIEFELINKTDDNAALNIDVEGVGVNNVGGIAATEPKMSPQNLLIYTIFKNTRTWLNNELISDFFDLQDHAAYLSHLFSASNACKKSQSQILGYFKDDFTKEGIENPGIAARAKMSKNGKTFKLRGRLFNSLFLQDKPILASDIVLKFFRNDPLKVVFGPCRLKLNNFKIHLVCGRLLADPALQISRQLNQSPENYHSSQIEMNTFHLTDYTHGTLKNISTGSLPNYVMIAFQTDTRFNGGENFARFYYKDPGISRVWLSNQNLQFPMNSIYKIDRTNKSYIEIYKNMFTQTKISSVDFDVEDVANGYFILTFDLSENFDRNIRSTQDSSDLQLHLDFHARQTGLNVIICLIRNMTISVNNLRQTQLTF